MSKQELLFKHLVREMICYKSNTKAEEETRLFNFFSQSEFHYDVFCESIYMLMTNNNINMIFLDEYGYTHFDYINNNTFAYELLCSEDIENINDDIVKYIELALNRLKKRLEALNQLSIIKMTVGVPKQIS